MVRPACSGLSACKASGGDRRLADPPLHRFRRYSTAVARLDPTRIEDWAEVERFFEAVVELDDLAGRQLSWRDKHAIRACVRVAREVRIGLQQLHEGRYGADL